MFTENASIGQISLVPTLRVMDNYIKHEIIETVDRESSGCRSCSNYNSSLGICIDERMCQFCESKISEQNIKKKYINEKNRFGDVYALKKYAYLLFLYIHFQNPDKNGLVRIHVEDAAEYLKCTERSIHNNIKLLQKHQFIASSYYGHGLYQIFILNYKDYFKKAEQGGRGYYNISKSLLDQLTTLEDINSIRLTVRTWIEASDLERKKSFIQEKDISEMHRYLPKYFTLKKLRSILNGSVFQEIFNLKQRKYHVTAFLNDKFSPWKVNEDVKTRSLSLLKEVQEELSELAKEKHYERVYEYNDKDIETVSRISLRIPFAAIKRAIKVIYEEYTVHGYESDILNYGGLLRTVAEYEYEIMSIA